MKLLIYISLIFGLIWLADWLWYQYWYRTARLAMVKYV